MYKNSAEQKESMGMLSFLQTKTVPYVPMYATGYTLALCALVIFVRAASVFTTAYIR